MRVRVATCRCGQLQASCTGEPVRISVCHCLDCQKQSGSAFSTQARWPEKAVTVTGDFNTWSRIGDEGSCATFRFCPRCGSNVAYTSDAMPGFIAVLVGAFADPSFPAPRVVVYEERQHPWARIVGDDIERWA